MCLLIYTVTIWRATENKTVNKQYLFSFDSVVVSLHFVVRKVQSNQATREESTFAGNIAFAFALQGCRVSIILV
jgi:hypothetical protein